MQPVPHQERCRCASIFGRKPIVRHRSQRTRKGKHTTVTSSNRERSRPPRKLLAPLQAVRERGAVCATHDRRTRSRLAIREKESFALISRREVPHFGGSPSDLPRQAPGLLGREETRRHPTIKTSRALGPRGTRGPLLARDSPSAAVAGVAYQMGRRGRIRTPCPNPS
jgi:hypothetical protein